MTVLNIENLVPHKPPMRLLDGFASSDEKTTTCVVKLTHASPFLRQGRVPAVVAMEYMAQCVAAYATLHTNTNEGEALPAPKLGYLVGVRRLDLFVDGFVPGDELIVKVTHVWGAEQGAQFQGSVTRDGEVVASANLTVFVPPDQQGAL